jgi:hypothetical protein
VRRNDRLYLNESHKKVGSCPSSGISLALPNVLTAGAPHGVCRLLFGQLLFANRARFCHYVSHNSWLLSGPQAVDSIILEALHTPNSSRFRNPGLAPAPGFNISPNQSPSGWRALDGCRPHEDPRTPFYFPSVFTHGSGCFCSQVGRAEFVPAVMFG